LWEFLGSSLASLLSGYFWPRELRQFLFYGDVEDKKSEDEKVKEEAMEEVRQVVKEVTRLETKVDKLETKVDKLETKVDKLETKVDRIIELLEDLKNRTISGREG
jgi:peptidoglycan hydrolase CwlO-like protein